MIKRSIRVLVASMILSNVTTQLQGAQPDAGTIRHEVERAPFNISEPRFSPSIRITEKESSSTENGTLRISVKRFVFEGVTLISEPLLQKEVVGFVDRLLTIDELDQAARRVTSAYVRAGYIAEAFVPPQEVADGVVTIRVVEARLGKVIVEEKNGVRLSRETAAAYVTTAQPTGQYVDTVQMERGLRLLQATPGVRSSALIRKGSIPSTVDAVLTLEPASLVRGEVGFDNFGGETTGQYRISAGVSLESPTGRGDRIALKTLNSEGLNYARLSYSQPLGTDGVTAGVSASWLGYQLGDSFRVLDATGASFTAGGFVSKNLIAGKRSIMTGAIGYDYHRYKDDVMHTRLSDKNLHLFTFGLSGGLKDDFIDGAWSTGGFSVVSGVLDLSKIDDLSIIDSQTARTAGSFAKLTFNLSREQYLFREYLRLYTAVSGQITSDNLDSSEKFFLGGPYGLRAYPQGEGAGDSGLLISTELRIQAAPAFQLFYFYDWGMIRQYNETWDGWQTNVGEPNTYTLNGIGMGIQLTPLDNLKIRGTVAMRLKQNPLADAQGHDHDGTRRDPRFWIEASYAL